MGFFLISTADMAISIANNPLFNNIHLDPDINYYYEEVGNQKKIALTFDDGPHPEKTLKIVEILERNEVPAAFFFIGKNILKYPKIAKKVYDAGFEIGNHTFTHSHKVHKSEKRLDWELNSTNKLIEKITGRSTLLYRPPFLLDIGSDPFFDPNYNYIKEDGEAPAPSLKWADNNGYIVVGADIDPKDWNALSSEEIITNAENAVSSGHIMLFHDGSEGIYTVQALEPIIKSLKSKGYEFVSLPSLLGPKENSLTGNKLLLRNTIMPKAVGNSNSIRAHFQDSYLAFISFVWPTLYILIFIMIILAIIRVLFILSLLAPKNKSKKKWWHKGVSVIIPAYNENKNIRGTIYSVLKNKALPREIIVVDDGSTDDTAEKVKEIQKELSNSPIKLILIQVENGGKAKALNTGINIAKSNIIIAIDGDTIISRNAIANLVRHFKNKEVGAVTGKIHIARRKNILEKFQSLEYIISQNIEKKAFASINAINVVSGAIGAWRKSDVINSGGYSQDTLVEDQDLTLAILSQGKKIIYEPKAIVYTEAPGTLKDFLKQRFRWVFGTMQCFWKYKRNIRKRSLAWWTILSNVAIYNIFIPLFSPLIDILLILSIFFGFWNKALIAYIIFTLFDFLYAIVGLWQEKKSRHLLYILPIQRIFYRQILYYIVIKSIIKALLGTRAIWNKLKRMGHAQNYYLKNMGNEI